ncbi:MAG: TonB-dependent receptor, partial [Leeuwenhoekiella marinoflava]
MKYLKNYIIISVMLLTLSVTGQERVFTALDSVYLTDSKLKEFSTGRNLISISDSLLRNNSALLTNMLNFNTPVY